MQPYKLGNVYRNAYFFVDKKRLLVEFLRIVKTILIFHKIYENIICLC